MLSRLRSLWRNLAHRDRMQRDLDDELRAMFDLLVEEKIARGMEPWAARRDARIELGGVEPLKERVRDVKMGALVDAVMQDLKHAVRHFGRSPAFALAAILTLALGIGANTAMFSVLNTLAFQKLAVADPDGLYSLSSYNERGQKRYIPMPTVIDLNRDGPFVEACGYNGGGWFAVEANGIPAQAITAFVTGRCISVFGVQPSLGRGIVDADAPIMTPGEKVVVISHRLWQRLYNRDPNVVGKGLKVEGIEAIVVGVMPPAFRAIHADVGADILAPPDTIFPATPGRRPVAQEVLGRLKPGITFDQAQAQLNTIWPALVAEGRQATRNANEGTNLIGDVARLDPMTRGLSPTREQHAQTIQLILGLTTLLLLLACVNLGGLLLTRLSARSTELGVRLALGGSRRRIAQQMLIESLVLSGAGTLLAVPLAFAFVAPLPSLMDPGFVGWEFSFRPDLRVLAVTALVGLTVGVLLTTLPTWFAVRRRNLVAFTWDRTTTGAASRWTRGLLVAQVALSIVMVIGAALLTRSLYHIQTANPGVRTANLMTAQLSPLPGISVRTNPHAHYPPLVEKLEAIPGVSRVAMTAAFPRRLSNIATDVSFVGNEFSGIRSSSDRVTPNFFEIAGIPLLAGRGFAPTDTQTSPTVVIVSASLARALAPDGDVVGRRMRIGTAKDRANLLIVGIAGNATQGDIKNSAPNVVYTVHTQAAMWDSPHLLLAVDGDRAEVAAAARRVVVEHGREFVNRIDMVDDLLARGPIRERMSALLSALIGMLAVLLAVIGIHGVLAYSVSRRTREIGVRVAVGADPAGVARSIVGEGLRLTMIGVAVGLPAAYFSARALRAILFGISESDAVSFAASAVFFAVLGALAGILPARRAARIDPAITLRSE